MRKHKQAERLITSIVEDALDERLLESLRRVESPDDSDPDQLNAADEHILYRLADRFGYEVIKNSNGYRLRRPDASEPSSINYRFAAGAVSAINRDQRHFKKYGKYPG